MRKIALLTTILLVLTLTACTSTATTDKLSNNSEASAGTTTMMTETSASEISDETSVAATDAPTGSAISTADVTFEFDLEFETYPAPETYVTVYGELFRRGTVIIPSNPDAQDQINATMSEVYDRHSADFAAIKDLAMAAFADQGEALFNESFHFATNASFQGTIINDRLISFDLYRTTTTEKDIFHSRIEEYTFDVATGKLLTLDDLFTDIEAAKPILFEKFLVDAADEDVTYSGDLETLLPEKFDNSSWSFYSNDNGIHFSIIYQQDDISADNDACIDFSISVKDLAPYLTDYAKTLFPEA